MSRAEAVVGYARVSRGANDGSLEAQRAAIGAECERRGEAGALVVARLDRLARSLSEAAQLLARAKRQGWNLVALDLGLDLSTSEGERVANQFASVAAWERQLLSARSRETLAHARAQGVKLGTPRRTPAATVAKISRLQAQGLTLQAIADELNRYRVPTTRGGSKWRPSSVRSVLSRRS